MITGAAATRLEIYWAEPKVFAWSALFLAQFTLMRSRFTGSAAARKELRGLPFVGQRRIALQNREVFGAMPKAL
jgi:hypothetical protein